MSKSHLDTLLADTSSTLDLLSTLCESFKVVEAQTSGFRKQCEGLLSTRKHSLDLADNIRDNLQYYDFLDPASRRLNAPSAGSTVRGKEFSDMLRRLDECLDYMEAHVRPWMYVGIFIGKLLITYSLSKRKPNSIALDTGCS